MNRYLVAGGTGFIGRNLVEYLANRGDSVVSSYHNKLPVFLHPNVEYVQCDLTKESDCKKIMRNDIQYVFMCAANTSGALVIENKPLDHVAPNVIMNTLMLDAAYLSGVEKFLFISSSTVYPVTDYAVNEQECTGSFFDKYYCVASMKRFSETLCEMYATKIKKPMTTIVVRPGNIYGIYDDFEWETAHVIPALIRRVVERHNPLIVWGDGSDIKDFLYIDDFVKGIVSAMENTNQFDIINVASGCPITIREIVDLIIKLDGYAGCNLQYDTSKPTMIPKRLIDITKAKDILNFNPSISMEKGLRKTIEWFRNA